MKKALFTFRNYCLAFFEYRFEILSGFLVNSVELAMSVFLWSAIIRENGMIGSYNLPGIISYFVLARIFSTFKSPGIAKTMEKYIQRGTLSNLLVMPYSPIIRIVGKTASQFCINTLLALAVFGLPYVFLPQMRATLFFNEWTIFWLIAYIFFSLTFNWSFWFCFGCLSFWMVRSSGLRNVIGQISTILRGSLFPIDLAPHWFQSFVGWLPFQYLIYYPVKIITSQTDTASNLKGLMVLFIFTIVLSLVATVLWRKGLKTYSAVGM